MDIFKTWLVETPIAHKGYHDETSPENSISAFKKAVAKGYAIELDVQLISDGTVVVFHDESLSRMTGNDGYLKFLTKDDLPMLYLKDSKETIPTLEEVLKVVNGETPIIIEIKNTGKVGELEQKVIDLLKKYKGEVAVAAFNPYVLGYFKDIKLSFMTKFILKRMSPIKKISFADFIMYEGATLPNRFVRKYKKLPLIAWTISSQEEYMRVVKYCDNVVFEGFDPKI